LLKYGPSAVHPLALALPDGSDGRLCLGNALAQLREHLARGPELGRDHEAHLDSCRHGAIASKEMP
jgi:hypothetical protein